MSFTTHKRLWDVAYMLALLGAGIGATIAIVGIFVLNQQYQDHFDFVVAIDRSEIREIQARDYSDTPVIHMKRGSGFQSVHLETDGTVAAAVLEDGRCVFRTNSPTRRQYAMALSAPVVGFCTPLAIARILLMVFTVSLVRTLPLIR